MLPPAGLEIQIFVDPKDAKNVPAEIKEQIREEVQSKGNMLQMATHYTLSDYQAEHQQLAKMRGDRYCNG